MEHLVRDIWRSLWLGNGYIYRQNRNELDCGQTELSEKKSCDRNHPTTEVNRHRQGMSLPIKNWLVLPKSSLIHIQIPNRRIHCLNKESIK